MVGATSHGTFPVRGEPRTGLQDGRDLDQLDAVEHRPRCPGAIEQGAHVGDDVERRRARGAERAPSRSCRSMADRMPARSVRGCIVTARSRPIGVMGEHVEGGLPLDARPRFDLPPPSRAVRGDAASSWRADPRGARPRAARARLLIVLALLELEEEPGSVARPGGFSASSRMRRARRRPWYAAPPSSRALSSNANCITSRPGPRPLHDLPTAVAGRGDDRAIT